MTCPHRSCCELLKLLKLKASMRFWTQKHCDTHERFTDCARFLKLKKGEPVAPTLLPSGDDLNDPSPAGDTN